MTENTMESHNIRSNVLCFGVRRIVHICKMGEGEYSNEVLSNLQWILDAKLNAVYDKEM